MKIVKVIMLLGVISTSITIAQMDSHGDGGAEPARRQGGLPARFVARQERIRAQRLAAAAAATPKHDVAEEPGVEVSLTPEALLQHNIENAVREYRQKQDELAREFETKYNLFFVGKGRFL